METHPKDWANPGRVKVLVKEDGRAVHAKIRNSKFGSRREGERDISPGIDGD
jgi:hypothetical protein